MLRIVHTCMLVLATAISSVCVGQQTATAVQLMEPLRIDGEVDDVFRSRPPLTDFVQFAPDPLAKSSQATHVWVGYDNTSLYITAELLDTAPDSVLAQLSERDRLRNTDWFGVSINPYRDGINATNFIVTPANVQYDSKFGAGTDDDSQVMQTGDVSWDGVWASASAKTQSGWVVEMRIPYSALRFPDEPVQTWDINFARQIRRYREESFWNPVDPKAAGSTTQMGKLVGITDIIPPIRLQATPFVTAGTNLSLDPDAATSRDWSGSLGGGLDLKYGISDAFTLDMTAIPDFSNARSDDQVLNLGANEIRFAENRAFFTEGVELFNKGNFFYSRRIGGFPINFSAADDDLAATEVVRENPIRTRLLNATKVSGRLQNGLGIGVFNAVEGNTFATVEDTETGATRKVETAPTTNYSVISFDQNLPHNSFVTLINTNVLRSGSTYDANLTGAVWDLRTRQNTWGFSGSGGVSQQYGLAQRTRSGMTNREDVFGHRFSADLRRLTGRLRYGLGYVEESHTYDPNDLGFLFFNNERSAEAYASYNWFEPFGKFNSASVGIQTELNYLYEPSIYTGSNVGFRSRFTTRKFFTFGAFGFTDLSYNREVQDSRSPGRYYELPQYFEFSGFVSSDYRKPFALDVSGTFGRFYSDGRSQTQRLSISPRVRIGDRLAMRLRVNLRRGVRYLGYVGHSPDEVIAQGLDLVQTPYFTLDPSVTGFSALRSGGILGSYRTVPTVELETSAEYSFTANMNVSLRVRHYWSRVNHVEFFEFLADGKPLPTAYTGLDADGVAVHDQNFNAFNVDLFYRWRFAPGSDVFLSYKTQSFFGGNPSRGYFPNLGTLGQERVDNSLTLKVVYFLDAAVLRRS